MAFPLHLNSLFGEMPQRNSGSVQRAWSPLATFLIPGTKYREPRPSPESLLHGFFLLCVNLVFFFQNYTLYVISIFLPITWLAKTEMYYLWAQVEMAFKEKEIAKTGILGI